MGYMGFGMRKDLIRKPRKTVMHSRNDSLGNLNMFSGTGDEHYIKPGNQGFRKSQRRLRWMANISFVLFVILMVILAAVIML